MYNTNDYLVYYMLLKMTMIDKISMHGAVPQGTKLGIVLFILMINDVQIKRDSYKINVDDTCILYTESDSHVPNLQEAADAAFL